MDKSTKTIVGVILLVAVVLVAVGYAAISSITLNITGTLSATADNTSDANFNVHFVQTTGATTTNLDVDRNGTNGSVTAETTGARAATMTVSGLSAKGESVSATFQIQNESPDLSAKLSAVVNSGNNDDFEVTYAFGKTTIAKAEVTTLTVTVKLKTTPIQDTDVQAATLGIVITADPVQPGV